MPNPNDELVKVIIDIAALQNEISNKETEFKQRLDVFSKKIDLYNADVGNFENKYKKFQEDVTSITQQADANDKAIEQLNKDGERYNQALAALGARYQAYKQQVEQINSKVDYYNGLVNSGNADGNYLAQLKAEIDELKRQAEAAGNQLNAEDDNLAMQKRSMDERDRVLTQQAQAIEAQISQLVQVKQELEAWANRLTATKSEILQEQTSLQSIKDDISTKTVLLLQLQIKKQEIEKRLQDENNPSNFIVTKGQLTFDAEGAEGGAYHSRKPHVPTDTSGVTIGRGYDLKERIAAGVISDLKNAGLNEADAIAYSNGVGLKGVAARDFIAKNNLCEITPLQQKNLFQMTYDFMENDCIRICNKPKVVEKYGTTDWTKLAQKIKDVVVDLRFRGDYSGVTRTFLQPLIVSNDLEGFSKVMADRSKWSNVPEDRFKRRAQYFNNFSTRLLLTSPRSVAFSNTNSTKSAAKLHLNNVLVPQNKMKLDIK